MNESDNMIYILKFAGKVLAAILSQIIHVFYYIRSSLMFEVLFFYLMIK